MASAKKILSFFPFLKRRRHSITESELELAKEIQSYMLPSRFPFPKKLEVGTIYEPAAHIGGDFYDVIQIDHRRAAFIIGDISGHSIAAAIFMTQCHTLIKTLIKMDLSLLKIAETANEILLEVAKPDMFATLFIGIFDSFYNQFSYINAGHPPPFLIRSRLGRENEDFSPISNLTAEGMALNCQKKFILEEKTFAAFHR